MELIDRLLELGAEINYSDPHISSISMLRRNRIALQSAAMTPERLAGCDAVIVVTDHDAFDYAEIARHARLVIDTRGIYRCPTANIVRG